jgi:hypothetical protein
VAIGKDNTALELMINGGFVLSGEMEMHPILK